jgi:hypothetical protein
MRTLATVRGQTYRGGPEMRARRFAGAVAVTLALIGVAASLAAGLGSDSVVAAPNITVEVLPGLSGSTNGIAYKLEAAAFEEERAGYCQLGADSALLALRGRPPSLGQQALVTASHAANARVLSTRW